MNSVSRGIAKGQNESERDETWERSPKEGEGKLKNQKV